MRTDIAGPLWQAEGTQICYPPVGLSFGAGRFGLDAGRFGVGEGSFGLDAGSFGVGAGSFGAGAGSFGVRTHLWATVWAGRSTPSQVEEVAGIVLHAGNAEVPNSRAAEVLERVVLVPSTAEVEEEEAGVPKPQAAAVFGHQTKGSGNGHHLLASCVRLMKCG